MHRGKRVALMLIEVAVSAGLLVLAYHLVAHQ